MLMYLAYRGINVLILAPLLALLAVVMSGDLPVLATYTQVFMNSLGGYVITYFPLFFWARSSARSWPTAAPRDRSRNGSSTGWALSAPCWRVVLSCGVLTFGGVSLFVVAFAVYPIANALFRRADIPKRLLPAAIALGSFTFTMTAFPGTPAIQNAIRCVLRHERVCGAAAGHVGRGHHAGGRHDVLNRRARTAGAEGYGDYPVTAADASLPEDADLPAFALAILPVVSVIVLNAVLTWFVFRTSAPDYLAEPQYGGTTLSSVAGHLGDHRVAGRLDPAGHRPQLAPLRGSA